MGEGLEHSCSAGAWSAKGVERKRNEVPVQKGEAALPLLADNGGDDNLSNFLINITGVTLFMLDYYWSEIGDGWQEDEREVWFKISKKHDSLCRQKHDYFDSLLTSTFTRGIK